jgi:tetratricopeptide (TPR) repeat protein
LDAPVGILPGPMHAQIIDYEHATRAFAAHYTQLLAREGGRLLGPQQLEALPVLRLELPNIMYALKLQLDAKALTELRLIARWLWRYLNLIGDYELQREAYTRILATGEQLDDRELQCQGVLALARIARRYGQTDAAQAHYERALELTQGFDPALEAAAHFGLGLLHWDRHELDQAAACFEHSIELYRAGHDAVGKGLALNLLGGTLNLQGRTDEALDLMHQSLAVLEAQGDRFGIAVTLGDIGIIDSQRKEYDEARAKFLQAHQLHRAVGSKVGELAMLNNMALLDYWTGNLDRALELLGQGLSMVREYGERNASLWLLNSMSEIMLAQDRPQQARQYVVEALRTGLTGEYWSRVNVSIGLAGVVLESEGRDEVALTLTYSALTRVEELKYELGEQQRAQIEAAQQRLRERLETGAIDQAELRSRELDQAQQIELALSLLDVQVAERVWRLA